MNGALQNPAADKDRENGSGSVGRSEWRILTRSRKQQFEAAQSATILDKKTFSKPELIFKLISMIQQGHIYTLDVPKGAVTNPNKPGSADLSNILTVRQALYFGKVFPSASVRLPFAGKTEEKRFSSSVNGSVPEITLAHMMVTNMAVNVPRVLCVRQILSFFGVWRSSNPEACNLV